MGKDWTDLVIFVSRSGTQVSITTISLCRWTGEIPSLVIKACTSAGPMNIFAEQSGGENGQLLSPGPSRNELTSLDSRVVTMVKMADQGTPSTPVCLEAIRETAHRVVRMRAHMKSNDFFLYVECRRAIWLNGHAIHHHAFSRV